LLVALLEVNAQSDSAVLVLLPAEQVENLRLAKPHSDARK
jgi:hypothetical protein